MSLSHNIFVLLLLGVAILLGFTVPAYGQSNPIVVENNRTGTTAWQLVNSANDTDQQIKGYASATSVNLGESVKFFVSVNPPQDFTISIYRMGWYNGRGGRLVTSIDSLSGQTQAALTINQSTGLITAPWSASHTLDIPTTWTSGVYLAKLTNTAGFDNYIIFTVRDDGRIADFLYQQPVTTYQAYNNFPNDGMTGKSLYQFPGSSFGANTIAGTPRAVKISFNRPYANRGSGDFFGWEYNFIRWAERSGYDISYSTNMDTHSNGQRLLNYKSFLSVGHDEYWSAAMYDAAAAARDAGINLAFFGANNIYWHIRFENSNRTIVSYKDASLDPRSNLTQKTILWRDLNRPEQALLGIQFDFSALVEFTADGSNNSDYVVQNSQHWVYHDTDFRDGDKVTGIIGYEADRQFDNISVPNNLSYTILSQSPMTDKKGVLLTTINSSIYQAPSGAWVFAAGTLSWPWALDNSSFPQLVDNRLQKTTANILDRFRQPPETGPIHLDNFDP